MKSYWYKANWRRKKEKKWGRRCFRCCGWIISHTFLYKNSWWKGEKDGWIDIGVSLASENKLVQMNAVNTSLLTSSFLAMSVHLSMDTTNSVRVFAHRERERGLVRDGAKGEWVQIYLEIIVIGKMLFAPPSFLICSFAAFALPLLF